MSTDDISQQIENLQNGVETTLARHKIGEYFFDHLRRYLGCRFDNQSAELDVEVAANSGVRNGLKVVEEGGLQRRGSARKELFNLMYWAAVRRARNQLRKARAQKRLPACRLADLPEGTSGDDVGEVLEQQPGRELPPGVRAGGEEECQRLLRLLPDDLCRQVVGLKVSGYTNKEIAKELGCSVSTVERKLALARVVVRREVARE